MAKQSNNKKRNAKKQRKTVRVMVLKHPAKPDVKRRAKTGAGTEKLSTAMRALTAVAVKEQFKTVQIRNVPAAEVDQLIAEETATADVVSVQKHDEGDSKFTVVFVYRVT